MKTFCIISGLLIGLVVPILLLDYYIDNDFLQEFMKTESLSIMGNMLAIYVGVVTAFTVILDNIRTQLQNNCSNTQATLKKNILTMLIIYGFQMVCLITTPDNYNDCLRLEYFIKGLEVLFFSLYFLMFYEIIDVFFWARKISQTCNTTPPAK